MTQRLAIIGFGGHGRVVLSALRAAGLQVVAATDLAPPSAGSQVDGIEVMTDEQFASRFGPAEVYLISGVGSVSPSDDKAPRRRSVQKFIDLGYRFAGMCHPFSWVAPEAHLAETCQIHAGSVIQPGAKIGEFTIINTRASVDHDCSLGDYCHIGPGATLSGNVEVGAGSHLGTGCKIIQGIKIGQGCLIAAGATVVHDVPHGVSVRGIPAREFRANHGRQANC